MGVGKGTFEVWMVMDGIAQIQNVQQCLWVTVFSRIPGEGRLTVGIKPNRQLTVRPEFKMFRILGKKVGYPCLS